MNSAATSCVGFGSVGMADVIFNGIVAFVLLHSSRKYVTFTARSF